MAIIIGTSAADTLAGTAFADEIYGLDGADLIGGGDGDDLLDGGAGSDQLTGGTGDDVYVVDEWNDLVVEAGGEGTDEVLLAGGWYVLADHVENAEAVSANAQWLGGNALDNVLRGGDYDGLSGGGGDDTLHYAKGGAINGDDGYDTYVLPGTAGDYVITREGHVSNGDIRVRVHSLADGTDNVVQTVEALRFEGDSSTVTIASLFDRHGTGGGDTLSGDESVNYLYGYGGDDFVYGFAGSDHLDGGAGADTMVGGTGDDVYVIDDSGDVIVEDADGDVDRAYVWTASYTMAANLYAAHARYDAGISITGNAGANQLWGGLGDDYLDGGGGNDFFLAGAGDDEMIGGTGNDSYMVDDAGDLVVEAAGGGTDIVYLSRASYALTAWVENVDLGYSSGARTLTGNSSNNLIIVSADSALTISGGSGIDTLDYSREGEALLIDLLTGEVDGAAADDVLSGIENLTGGEDDDELRGTAGANVLDGYWGADTLIGRGGNDLYLVDDPGDLVVEAAGEGTDEVRLDWMDEYALPDHVEKLRNLSSDPFEGTGNALNNDMTGGGGEDILHGGDGQDSLTGGAGDDFLHGEAGHDTLSGGSGEDWMAGGDGNDVFIADCEADVVVELAGEGIDQVFASSAAYTLPDEVENLNYNAYGGFHGTGNALANILYGGSGGDLLDGLAGDDELRGGGGADALVGGDGADLVIGGAGADLLEGGDGADTFRIGAYETGSGGTADSILDFESGEDLIDLSSIDADSGTAGDQAFTLIGAVAFSGLAGELRCLFDSVDSWLQADVDGDALADFEIMLGGAVTPLAGDFVV